MFIVEWQYELMNLKSLGLVKLNIIFKKKKKISD